jgi:hypothetical protein
MPRHCNTWKDAPTCFQFDFVNGALLIFPVSKDTKYARTTSSQ